MHKYQPRIHVIRQQDHNTAVINLECKGRRNFTFPPTTFIAVTAYQNQLVSFSQLVLFHNITEREVCQDRCVWSCDRITIRGKWMARIFRLEGQNCCMQTGPKKSIEAFWWKMTFVLMSVGISAWAVDNEKGKNLVWMWDVGWYDLYSKTDVRHRQMILKTCLYERLLFWQITRLKIDSNPFAKGFRDSLKVLPVHRYRKMLKKLQCAVGFQYGTKSLKEGKHTQ